MNAEPAAVRIASHPAARRIVVISDTHLPRFRARLADALARVATEGPDLILHCGDVTTQDGIDAFAAIAPIEVVAGNNDGPDIVRRYGRRTIVETAWTRVGLIHGDGARGSTLDRARAAYAGETVDVIAFGHSHIPYLSRHDGVWVVNPGSLTDRRRQPQHSFAVLASDSDAGAPPRIVRF